jgi:hypothetical protein
MVMLKLLMPTVLAVIYLLLIWMIVLVHAQLRLRQLGRRMTRDAVQPVMITSFFVVATYNYPQFTQAALSIFSCRTVDVPADLSVGEQVSAQGARWTQVGMAG